MTMSTISHDCKITSPWKGLPEGVRAHALLAEMLPGSAVRSVNLREGKATLAGGDVRDLEKDSEKFLELIALANGSSLGEASAAAKAMTARQVTKEGRDHSQLFRGREKMLDNVRSGASVFYSCEELVQSETVTVYTGIAVGALSLLEVFAGYKEKQYSESIGDAAGVFRGRMAMIKGTAATVGAALLITAKNVGSAVMLTFSYLFFGAAMLLSAIQSFRSFDSCQEFHRDLEELYGVGNQPKQVEETLDFLLRCLEPQEGENRECRELWLKRRTSLRSVDRIQQHAGSLLDALRQNPQDQEALNCARDLIDTVKKDNLMKRVLHALSGGASLLSFVAMALSWAVPGAHGVALC
jgi:hypothetical protein